MGSKASTVTEDVYLYNIMVQLFSIIYWALLNIVASGSEDHQRKKEKSFKLCPRSAPQMTFLQHIPVEEAIHVGFRPWRIRSSDKKMLHRWLQGNAADETESGRKEDEPPTHFPAIECRCSLWKNSRWCHSDCPVKAKTLMCWWNRTPQLTVKAEAIKLLAQKVS